MGILSWILIGLMVGFAASVIAKRRGTRRWSMLAAGLVGAAIGGLNVAFLYNVPGTFLNLNWLGMLAAGIGAVFTVGLLGLLTPQKEPAF
jgi:uncharacterized membrane protein YeaQ/YmgE (transglycosylase-associated protein family)